MSFAHPLALLLLLLLIPIALLYWLRLRVPRVVVGTGPFWQQALADEQFRARWQPWRTPVSLVLHMLTIVLLALAAAGPAIPPPQRIVLILDNSATMRATDVQPSRFEAAKEAARRMISGLRWCDEMAIVTTSPNPAEIQSPTNDRALLRAAVDSVKVLPEPPHIEWSTKVAREIAKTQMPSLRTVLITDCCERLAATDAQQAGAEVLRVGTPADNRAITCFTARRSKTDPTECQVFVEVQNCGDRSAEGVLQLSVNDKPGESASFAIEKDGRWQHLYKLKLPSAAKLTVKATPGDAYPFDDTARLDVPASEARNASDTHDEVSHPPFPWLLAPIAPGDSEGGIAAVDALACPVTSATTRPRFVTSDPRRPEWSGHSRSGRCRN